MENKKLTKPILYLSDYFARHKSAYYEALEMVRERNDIEHWIKFFLVAVSKMSEESCITLTKITELKAGDTEKVMTLGKRSELANRLLTSLFSTPIVNSKDVAESMDVTKQTAITLLNEMQKLGILVEITGFSRNRMFAYTNYVSLFSRGATIGEDADG
jgi:Fic family protein